MRTPETFISGIGVWLPDIVSVEQAVADGHYPAEQVDLHGLTGAAVAGDTPAPQMALHAATQALTRAHHPPTNLDLLLYADSWHQGPDGWQPQYYLQHHLTGGTCLAVELHHGCNGMFTALELAASYLHAHPDRHTALLVAADNFGTPMIDRWLGGPGYLMGDAGSALVLTTRPSFARLLAVGSVTVADAEELHRAGEPLFPPGPTAARPLDFTARSAEFRRAALQGGAGTAVLMDIQRQTLQVVDRTLAEAGIDISDVTRVAYMNYSREIVEQRCTAALGLPLSASTWDWGRGLGHLGASDQVAALDHLIGTGQLGPGDHLLMLGVGPGVTVSCAVVQIIHAPAWQ
ncbi:ketoacyl-ACP synthase III family protein [Micromonospora sp. HK10]|uniref:ketoacyl-ACP synthase III family protein n=1 Tax=Micromonospora sp. HK10 TaxID=1538294 RepID=UPI0006273728|nr:ketoacyl-ACP synthase III family protein [Micromonospora sp. HK10]KKK06306.1 3-oxoacyl-ACP synthase [Micromonospora sp. HK10]